MRGVLTAVLTTCLLAGLVGCAKKDLAVGTYKGVEHMTAKAEKDLSDQGIAPEVTNGIEAKMAKTEGTLTLNGDGTTSFSTNLSASVDAGKWMRRQDGYIVINSTYEQDWKPSADGRSLSYKYWILVKQ